MKQMRLTEEMIKQLLNRETVIGSGMLYSSEPSKSFKAEKAVLKLEPTPNNPNIFHLTINDTDIHDWFRTQNQTWLKQIVGMDIKQEQGLKI